MDRVTGKILTERETLLANIVAEGQHITGIFNPRKATSETCSGVTACGIDPDSF